MDFIENLTTKTDQSSNHPLITDMRNLSVAMKPLHPDNIEEIVSSSDETNVLSFSYFFQKMKQGIILETPDWVNELNYIPPISVPVLPKSFAVDLNTAEHDDITAAKLKEIIQIYFTKRQSLFTTHIRIWNKRRDMLQNTRNDLSSNNHISKVDDAFRVNLKKELMKLQLKALNTTLRFFKKINEETKERKILQAQATDILERFYISHWNNGPLTADEKSRLVNDTGMSESQIHWW